MGIVILAAISAFSFLMFYSRRRQSASRITSEQNRESNTIQFTKAELDGSSKAVGDEKERAEVDALEQQRFQLDAEEQAVKPAELHGEGILGELSEHREVFELPAEHD
jgi:hypothetical protein